MGRSILNTMLHRSLVQRQGQGLRISHTGSILLFSKYCANCRIQFIMMGLFWNFSLNTSTR